MLRILLLLPIFKTFHIHLCDLYSKKLGFGEKIIKWKGSIDLLESTALAEGKVTEICMFVGFQVL